MKNGHQIDPQHSDHVSNTLNSIRVSACVAFFKAARNDLRRKGTGYQGYDASRFKDCSSIHNSFAAVSQFGDCHEYSSNVVIG
jgi:hypothetical protein